MTQNIKIIIDNYNDRFETTVNATDRISILIDDLGTTVRSDGEELELTSKVSNIDMQRIDNFVNQMTLFDSKPWKMDI